MSQRRRFITKRLSRRTKRIQKQRANELFHVDQLLDQYPIDDNDDQQFNPFDQEDEGQEQMLDFPLQMIGKLPKKDRLILQKRFPTMPEYIFMSDKEKRKYFERKYSTFREKLNRERIVLKHSHNKKVRFTNNVEIKRFNEVDMPQAVRNSKVVLAKHSILSTRTM